MANICVFCGAKDGVQQKYVDSAFRFGEVLAEKGHTLVYGGGIFGLMGAVMRGTQSKGGNIIGVIPRFLLTQERGETLEKSSAELVITETLDERKKVFFERSDVIIALPGGIGTLDEFFEAFALLRLGRSEAKLGILNDNGFYDALISFLQKLADEKFLKQSELDDMLCIGDTPEELLQKLELV